MTSEDIFSTFLRVLNEAYEADPNALNALVKSHHVCNGALADHPFIQVAAIPFGTHEKEYYAVGIIGLLNGICEPLTGRRIAGKFSEEDSGGHSRLLGFMEYKSPSPAKEPEAPVAPKTFKDEDHKKLYDAIMEAISEHVRVGKLTDQELANEAIVEVWGQLKLNTPEEAVVDELIRRFQKLAGIPEDEDVG